MSFSADAFSSRRRNYQTQGHRRDAMIEWIKEMLSHSFVLNAPGTYRDTMMYIQELVEEHCRLGDSSKLKSMIPSIGPMFTPLPLAAAFDAYDKKYMISGRNFVTPSFNEIRHILNLAQVMAIKKDLKLITFDGDQTLYQDGGNFAPTHELAGAIIDLLVSGVNVAVVTAAGYGLDGSKYAVRLDGLLRAIEATGIGEEAAGRLYLMGGECNYLLRCVLKDGVAGLEGVPADQWQHPDLDGPKPLEWSEEGARAILDTAQKVMEQTIKDLRLRAKIIRKSRSVGCIPGGDEMVTTVPVGHGSKKLKREALDEMVLRAMDALRMKAEKIELPWCAFNGGRDAWVDVGDKSVGVAALQAWLGIACHETIHVGDQFLNVGNDIKAREQCPCLWILNPQETEKMLEHVLKWGGLAGDFRYAAEPLCGPGPGGQPPKMVMDVFTGLMVEGK